MQCCARTQRPCTPCRTRTCTSYVTSYKDLASSCAMSHKDRRTETPGPCATWCTNKYTASSYAMLYKDVGSLYAMLYKDPVSSCAVLHKDSHIRTPSPRVIWPTSTWHPRTCCTSSPGPRTPCRTRTAEQKPIVDCFDDKLAKLGGELVERFGLAIVIFQNHDHGTSR